MIDISVIIPLYNAEKYIKACVDSVLNQSVKNIEVIIVNDCTPDNSVKICEELYGNDNRVKIVHQEKNGGPGLARNSGIKHACGKYIAFVDSDDQVADDYFSTMFEAAEKYNADVLHDTGILISKNNDEPDMLSVSGNKLIKISFDVNPLKELTILEGNLDDRLQKWSANNYCGSPFAKLFRRDLIVDNNISFCNAQMAEDVLFSFNCLFHAKRYVILPSHGYIYRLNPGSISHAKKPVDMLLRSLRSQIIVLRQIQQDMKSIKFFAENEENYNKVLSTMNLRFENFHVVPAYKEIPENELNNNAEIAEFFKQYFGDDGAFIEHLFNTACKLHEDVPNTWAQMANPEFWEKLEGQSLNA